MTVAEMLRQISSRELTEWAAFYGLENEQQEPYEGAPVVYANEPPVEDEEPEDTGRWRELLARAAEINAALGGRDDRKSKPAGA